MLKKIITLIIIQFSFPSTLIAKELNVFACEPEWKSLVEEIGGKKVKAISATHAKQDPHYIRARPSLISKIRREFKKDTIAHFTRFIKKAANELS